MDSLLPVQEGSSIMILMTEQETMEQKLIVTFFNTSVAQNFYPIEMQLTTTWNAIPNEVVSCRTVNSYKNRLDKHWAENPSDD